MYTHFVSNSTSFFHNVQQNKFHFFSLGVIELSCVSQIFDPCLQPCLLSLVLFRCFPVGLQVGSPRFRSSDPWQRFYCFFSPLFIEEEGGGLENECKSIHKGYTKNAALNPISNYFFELFTLSWFICPSTDKKVRDVQLLGEIWKRSY